MKTTIVSGSALATAAVALALSGAAPAAAEDKAQTQSGDKAAAHKMSCGAKNSCGSKAKGDDKDKAAKDKPADAKDAK